MVNIKDVLKIVTYLCVVCGYASVVPYVQMVYTTGFLALFGFAVYLDITSDIGVERIRRDSAYPSRIRCSWLAH